MEKLANTFHGDTDWQANYMSQYVASALVELKIGKRWTKGNAVKSLQRMFTSVPMVYNRNELKERGGTWIYLTTLTGKHEQW